MKKWSYLIGFFLFALALLFRFQTVHVPFWVDEFSSAYQANLLLRFGPSVIQNPNYYFEYQNITTHALIALFFKLFGENEFIARLPMMLIGSTVPVALYYLGRKVADKTTGFIAALLAIFSYFMITWSRQARGYVLQQLLVLVLFWTYFKILESKRRRLPLLILLMLTSLAGVLTHTMFLIALIAMALHFCVFQRHEFFRLARQPLTYLFVIVLVAVSLLTGLANQIFVHLTNLLSGQFFNNFWYYHSFLWREYSLITFLGVVGIAVGLFTRRRYFSLLGVYLLGQLAFLSFFFGPYVSRYTLPIFPLLLLGMAYTITYGTAAILSVSKFTRLPRWTFVGIPLLITLAVIANGDKFTLKPKSFYSVDHDFREIALIDYDQVYAFIRQKGALDKGQTAVIDTWGDRTLWYLGDEFKEGYVFRWLDTPGLMKETKYSTNQKGEKIIVDRNNTRFVGELSDLQLAMVTYPKGFIWIDDSTLSPEIIAFAEKNFKKELFLDHYTLDDNPYSLWPGTLYSWGFAQ